MKERPILFSGPMIRALLEGRKTQTRRLLKPVTSPMPLSMEGVKLELHPEGWACLIRHEPGARGSTGWPLPRNPYGSPGDRLWVRETWDYFGGNEYLYQREPGAVLYRADPEHGLSWADRGWRPGIHMPRWASRITLEVTGVRVERLQDIGERDAIAEGLEWVDALPSSGVTRRYYRGDGLYYASAAKAFAHLWDSLNAKRAPWASKPWVWVVEFRRAEAAARAA